MEINTHYFGSVTYEEKDLICFEEGLFGFPNSKVYLPLSFNKESDSMLCLQSIDEPQVSFILMNPFLLAPDYAPVLAPEDQKYLAVDKEENISYYVICVMRDTLEECTVNLKCPIAVNVSTRQAKQVILDNSSYTFRHPLNDFLRNKEG